MKNRLQTRLGASRRRVHRLWKEVRVIGEVMEGF